jgi:hypothetical protein
MNHKGTKNTKLNNQGSVSVLRVFVVKNVPILLALLLGVAGTIQYHSQQFFSGFDTFFGDRGDVRGFVYFCEHWYQSILGKASLLSPGIFYPTKRTLAYSDLLFGFAAPYSFFRALGFSMFSSVEIVIILSTFLSYCAAFLLLYRILGLGLAPSCAGAMFFAFNSPKFHQTTHLQLQYVLLLPLIFALVITFAKRIETIDQKRAAVLLSLAALCLNLQLATTFYFAWFFVVWSVLFLLLALAFSSSRLFIVAACRKFWPALIAGAVVFLLGFISLLLLYLPAMRLGTWYQYDFVSEMIPDWKAVLSMGDGNYLWGGLYRALMPEPRPSTWGELMVGIGLVPSLAWIALTVSSVWFIKGRGKETTGTLFLAIMILATSIFYLIGFKYMGHSPWNFIYQYFPGAGAIRAVSRYVVFLTLPVSIAFAYGLHKALEFASTQRKQALTIVVLVIAAFGVFEQFGIPRVNGAGFSKSIEESYLKTMAARLPKDCTAFYVAPGPHANHVTPEYQYDAMLISAISRVKTLNASSSQFPRDWNMYFVKNPDYESNVKNWIESQRIFGKVCRLELAPEVEAFDLHTPSPIDEPEFFVRQLYRDFAGKEPELEVLMSQIERIRNCRIDDETCARPQVALNVFLATSFHQRGFFILRMYEAGLGRTPRYEEFMDAMRRFSDDGKMLAEFAQLNNLDEQSLREQVESDELVRKLGNRSLVVLHYFGYLRRDPDPAGVAAWVDLLERSGDATRITEGFINSVEYRQRFR